MPPATRTARRRGRPGLHDAAWPDLFANLQTAYGEVSRARAELERRTAQTEETRDLLRLVIESMSEALFLLDQAGRIQQANPAAGALLGRDHAEIVGQSFRELAGTDRIAATPWELLERAPSGMLLNLEVEVAGADGQAAPVSASSVLVRDKRGKIIGTLVVARDITERRRAEEAIRRLNQDLQRRADELVAANRELEAFSYSVSHDLRAPLRAVDGFSRILLEDHSGDLAPEAVRYLNLVREGAQQMGQLIDDLLDFSRLSRQPLRRQTVQPAAVARRVVEELTGGAADGRLEVAIAEMPACEADPSLLRQIYANLIGNAIKFSRNREHPRIEVGWHESGGEVVYFVKDNGVGFDMRYADKVFGVFQRLHRAEEYEGTGVGMAIVQRIVHRHGGRIWAEAAVDRGAAFYFTLGRGDAGD